MQASAAGQIGRSLPSSRESGLELLMLLMCSREWVCRWASRMAVQRPADAFGAVGDNPGGDQGVEDLNVALGSSRAITGVRLRPGASWLQRAR